VPLLVLVTPVYLPPFRTKGSNLKKPTFLFANFFFKKDYSSAIRSQHADSVISFSRYFFIGAEPVGSRTISFTA